MVLQALAFKLSSKGEKGQKVKIWPERQCTIEPKGRDPRLSTCLVISRIALAAIASRHCAMGFQSSYVCSSAHITIECT
jgi:hypothetical protein